MKSNLKHLLSRVMLMLVAVAGGGIISSCDKSIADNPAVPTTVTVNTFMADGTTPLPVTTLKLISVGTNNTYDLSAAIPEGGASTFSTEFLVNDHSNDWYFDAFATDANGKSYTANIYYHPMRGQAQTLNVKLKETAAPADDSDDTPTVTDLSMVDNAGNARSTMSTANCYMVHTAGDYKLPLVYGNAIKDGADNTVAYKPGGTSSATYCANFKNHAGTAIDAPWITKATTGTGADKGMGITVATAELLWQDAQGLITAVGISGDYLTLTVGKDATTKEGNAVIAAKSSDDKIVWSWHIWVTKETFAAADLTTVTTGTGTLGTDYQIYKVTPVNLGWVPTSDDGKQGYAPYYQWGRKDAFIPGTGSGNTNHTVYDIDGNPVATPLTPTSSTDATIADNIKNPTTHYYNSTTNGPCNTTYYNMWDAQQTSIDDIKTATKKTVYDPCPAGFCVPTGNLFYFIGDGNSRSMGSAWDGTNKGATWDTSISGNPLFFPASGWRADGSGALNEVGNHCDFWSASPNSNSSHGRTLYFNSSNWYWGKSNRAHGFPIRAVAEE